MGGFDIMGDMDMACIIEMRTPTEQAGSVS